MPVSGYPEITPVDALAQPYLETHRFHILSEILVVTIILHVR